MSTARREFLKRVGATSLLAAAGSVVNSHSLSAQSAKPVDSKWDMSWTDKVNGKYKAIFDSPDVSEGAALFRACIWRDQHKDVYGTARSDTSPVLVFRHAAIDLVMNDGYWDHFNVGKEEKLKDSKNKWIKNNPIHASSPEMPPAFKDYNLVDFMAQGGVVLGCNMAFSSVIARYQKDGKMSSEDASKAAHANIIPGIILQPSGIFAALRAQELGCNYVMAS